MTSDPLADAEIAELSALMAQPALNTDYKPLPVAVVGKLLSEVERLRRLGCDVCESGSQVQREFDEMKAECERLRRRVAELEGKS